MDRSVLATDLGGTNLRMAVVSQSGVVRYRTRCETPRDQNAMSIVHAIVALADECQREFDYEKMSPALGIAAPVIMDLQHGTVSKAPNLPMLNGFALKPALERETNLRVVLENDATAAAIGENWLGATQEVESSICVTLGTGVGGGIILNGAVLRGPDGTAGEIGHICVEPDGHPCGCGSRGCVEQYASATALIRIYGEMLADARSPVSGERRQPTAEGIYEAAKDSDEIARQAFEKVGYYLGIALAGLINSLNPEAIVIAGGLSNAWELFGPETQAQITKRTFREPGLRAKLVRAKLGDDAGLLGVARSALTDTHQGHLES